MADVAFRVTSSPNDQKYEIECHRRLSSLLETFRTAKPEEKASTATTIVRHISANYIRLQGAASSELGHLLLAGTKALVEIGKMEEVELLISEASQEIKVGHRAAACFLSLAKAHIKKSIDDIDGAVNELVAAGGILLKTNSSMLSNNQAKYLLTEYTKLLGEVACEYSKGEGDLAKLASRGMELIKKVNNWALGHMHLAAGGYVAIGLWRLAEAAASEEVPRNSVGGDAPAIVYGLRAAISGWEKIGGNPSVLMTCKHLFGKFLFSRERVRVAAHYFQKARSIAEALPDGVSLASILLDQLAIREGLPKGTTLESLDGLDGALAMVWGFLKDNDAPLLVRGRFALKSFVLSSISGKGVVSDSELDQLIIETLEHVGSVSVPDSLYPALFALASTNSERVVRILNQAHSKFPPVESDEDGLSHVVVEVVDYISSLGSMQSNEIGKPLDTLISILLARDAKSRTFFDNEPELTVGVESPRFLADLIRSCRTAFLSAGELPRETEEILLKRVLHNLLRSSSKESGFAICSRLAGIFIMLNSSNPNWDRIEPYAAKIVETLQPFVATHAGSEKTMQILALSYFIKSVAQFKRGDESGALQPFIEFTALLSAPDSPSLEEADARMPLLVGMTRFEHLLERKKLALFIQRAGISLNPNLYPSEIEDEGADYYE